VFSRLDTLLESPTIPGSQLVPWTEYHLLRSIEPFRDIRIETSAGKPATSLLYQMRQVENERYIFICNTERVKGVSSHVYIKGTWQVLVMDPFKGDMEVELETSQVGGRTVFPYHFDGTASVLLRLVDTPSTSQAQLQRPVSIEFQKTLGEVSLANVVLSEPNVLLLDYARFRLAGDVDWAPLEEVRIENIVRKRLKLPLKLDNFKQPWAISVAERSPIDDLHLRFTFESLIDIPAPILALEDALSTRIFLNGAPVSYRDSSDYWVDEAIKKVILPPIYKGTQTLELVYKFGIMTNIERVYLLGDFGVNLQGRDMEIIPKQTLTFGDWTRQGLPFYAGNITYKCSFTLPSGSSRPIALSVPQFVAPVLSVTLDCHALGHIFVEPRMLKLQSLRMRNRESAMATATEWTVMFIIVLITPTAVENIGYRIYLIFVIVTTFSIILAFFTYPETKGCTLEEMDHYFEFTRSWNVRKTYNIRKTLDSMEGADYNIEKVAEEEFEYKKSH
jgi:hypothetical protein